LIAPAATPGSPRSLVLVVENEPDHRRAVVLTLRLGGFEAAEAVSGEDALATLQGLDPGEPDDPDAPGSSPLGGFVPDALVLDVRLPGIDGLEVLERLRGQMPTRSLPVVLISAHAKIPNPVQGDERTRFLAKPFHPDQLLEHLDQLLVHRAGQAP
jgi:CheY-like chemotaxis protein